MINNKEFMDDYTVINLENGEYIKIKYDAKGVVCYRFDSNNKHIESYGFDLYNRD